MCDLYVSPKYGVNPSMSVCFYCQKHKNEVILAGKLKGDAEAPHKAVWNKEPCNRCKSLMAAGIICISVDEKKSAENMDNPYRTGGWCVIKTEAFQRIAVDIKINPPELVEAILKERVVFLPDEIWDMLNLPRSEPYPLATSTMPEEDVAVDLPPPPEAPTGQL